MNYRKRPDVVVANPWHRNGDHPGDGKERDADGRRSEGRVVRYLRSPASSGQSSCVDCGRMLREHGWIDGGPGQMVCPGDFILGTPETGYTAMHPDAFAAAYAMDHDS